MIFKVILMISYFIQVKEFKMLLQPKNEQFSP
jgi:hypothetical protein